jgi:hypothetical protein
MWNVNTEVIPLITGTTAIILESFRKYLSNTPEAGHQGTKENTHTGHSTYFGKS